jgi:hypothetical protein
MATYVQAVGGTIWHWCRNCSHYPATVGKTRGTRPSWDLCDECKAKQRAGTCRT